jgi:GNAT superfamily N-acetyltransferase
MSAMLYDLTVFDRVSSRASDGKGLLLAGVELVSLREIAAGPAADVRSRSFARMVFRVAAAFDPPLPLTVTDCQHVLIAQAGQDSVGLSIIGPEGRFGFDMLTWVEAPWRHQGIGTAMKYRAVQNARRAGITALWAPGDARSVAFYKTLGVAPAAGFTAGLPRDLPD